MALEAGTRLGPYVIVELRGKGGMGEVHRAQDTRLGRDVAAKALPPELSREPAFMARSIPRSTSSRRAADSGLPSATTPGSSG